jgi:putative MATE family efflux protein
MNNTNSPLSFGTEKIGKLLMQYAIPAIIAMTAASLYNITDSIFIGHGVGPLALSGLAITFPLMNLAAAFGTLVGVGASTLLSIRMGQKDYETANHILGNVLVLNLIMGSAFSVVMLLFLKPLLIFFGASEATLPYAYDFMQIILMGNVVTHMYFGMNALLRSAGHPQKAMMATIYTVLINLVLNPLFIFGFHWGIRGSAFATIIAQVIVIIWQFHLFNDKNSFIHWQKGIYKLKKKIVVDSLSIGLSPFLMNAASCLIVIIINQQLIRHGGDMAVGAYGIVNRVAFLFIMIVLGVNQGMQPIAGYNYGARNMQRVWKTLKLGIIAGVLITSIGTFFFEFFPRFISGFFTNSKELIDIAVPGLRICALMFPVVGCQVVISTFFQSIGRVKISIFLALCRQLIYFLPCLLIFPVHFGQKGVWAAIPVADFLSFVTAAVCLLVYMRKLNNSIE